MAGTFKAHILSLRILILHPFLFLIFASTALAQPVIFSENMGTSGAASNPPITTFTLFQNFNCLYAFSGTGDVRNTNASTGYTGASGLNNVFLDNGASKTFIISGINTMGYTGLSLSYGVYKNQSLLNLNGAGLTVEVSADGISYTTLTRPGGTWGAAWRKETCTGTIPASANLFIRFVNATGFLFGTDFKIDDVVLVGNVGAATDPTPYNGWPANYSFATWPASSTATTYPANMIFHYVKASVVDPILSQAIATQNYSSSYSLTCGTRVKGLGANGISFYNANPGHVTVATGNLGEAVVSLNTSCRDNIRVSWSAGTINNNGLKYRLIAQYRIGTSGNYTDLPNSSLSQIEYTSPSGIVNFGPITLPATCNNQAHIQIRWAYYWAGTGSGTADEISLDDVIIVSDPIATIYAVTGGGSYCSGGTGVAIGLSNSQVGSSYQLKLGASIIGSPVAGTGSAISFGNQTTAGTYTVVATNAVTSCTSAMTGNAIITINALPSINAVSSQVICGGKTIAAINFSSPSPGATFTWTNSNTSVGLASSGSGNIASYVSPLVPSPPNVVGTVSVAAILSGCTGTTTTFSITVKGPQPASVWNGTISNNWFDSGNWSNCVCGSITSATIPSIAGPNFNPVIAGSVAANVNTITLNAGANLSFQTTQTLNVFGNWINNGSFTAQQGNVILSGSSVQTLSGTTTFYDLTLNNSAGASLSSAQQIQGSLQLNAGTLNTNNNLTLISNATGTGKIGPINSAADIINQVTIQTFAPGGSTGWALLGAPLSSPTTMASWNDNFAITCLSCPDGSVVSSVPFTSIYSYDETIPGTYSATAKYIPITTISTNITNGVGYWTYLGNGFPNTTAITFDVKGSVAKSSCLSCSGAVTIPVSRTTNNGLLDDGWNLIANPLPSPISWAALRNGNANVDNAVYVFNADLNGGSGAHTTYINGVSSDVVGGITDVIPMCQGFYIHATGSTVLTANESIKVNANPTFLKTNTVSTKPIVRLVLDGPNNSNDMATFYFEQGGTTHFQTDLDAYKLLYDPWQPYVASMSDTVLTCINGLGNLNSNMSIPVKAITAITGNFNFSLLKSDFPDNVCVTLIDAFTGITTDIINSNYSCTLYDTTTTARFTLNFFTTPLAGTSSASQPNCSNPAGLITAKGNNAGPWNYEWKNNNTIVKTSLNKTTADSLFAINGGNYTVKINTVGQCDNYSQVFNINGVVIPISGFTANSFTTTLSNAGQIIFTDQSINAQTYFWDFGDGVGTSTSYNPSYSYSVAGSYLVKLVTQSADFCSDTAMAFVTVVNDVAGTTSSSINNSILLLYDKTCNGYAIKLSFSSPEDVQLDLHAISGQLIRSENFNSVTSNKLPVDLSLLPGGIYLFTITAGKNTKTFKLVK